MLALFVRSMRGMRAYLDEVLALGLGDERLQLGRGEGVDEAGLGDDEEQHLGAGEDRELVGLQRESIAMLGTMRRGHGASSRRCATVKALELGTHLFHDAGLALGKGDVATRLVLDELDFNLSALAAGLVVVVVIVVGSGARALGAAVGILLLERAVAVVDIVLSRGRLLLLLVGDFGSHLGCRGWLVRWTVWVYCIGVSCLEGNSRRKGWTGRRRPRREGKRIDLV